MIAVAPSPCSASLADVLTAAPRIGLALELDYRARFLNADDMLAGDAPADRVGRERLDHVRVQIARAYLDQVADAMADEVIEQVAVFRTLQRRYREYASVELLRADEPAPASSTGGLLRPPPPRAPRLSLRLRLNTIGDGFDLAPGLHFMGGLLDWRVAYRPLSNRVEMSARRPLSRRIALEMVGGQSVEHGGPDLHLALTWNF